jgi:transposase
MDRYIGLDAHSQTCTIGVMSPTGRRLQQVVVSTNGKALVDAIKSVPGTKHLCFEEGAQSEWLYELLSPHVHEVVVTQPVRHDGTKSDEIDTWNLADRVRTGSVARPIYKAPGLYTGLREAVRAHDVLVKDRTRAKNRLKAIFRSRAINGTASDLYDQTKREEWLKKLPTHRKKLATLLGEELDAITIPQEEAEKWLLEEARRCPSVKLLTSVPGLGWIRAAQIVAIVVSPNRFRQKQQFWSYCGLGIVTRSSADWKFEHGRRVRTKTVVTRGLNTNRQPTLKSVFKGAAKTVESMEQHHPLRIQYDSLIARNMKPSLARVTVARKIACIALAVWKNKEEYDPTKSQPTKPHAA